MPKRVQMVRHNESAANLYVGLAGQITVDETNNEIRVHNGSTAGGIRTARQDLANVAVATTGSAGKMSAAQVTNLEQVTTDLDAAEVLIAANAADIDSAEADIASNAADIAANAADIASNAADIATNAAALAAHEADTDNPHEVTVAQIGLTPEADAAWTAGTSTDPQATTPAKVRLAIRSFLNWPAGVSVEWNGSSVPVGTLAEDGSAVSRTTYAALFSVIGTTFGSGDGSTTFNLPDSRGRVAVGSGTGAGLTARVLGTLFGAEGVVMTLANLILHGHPFRQKTTQENQTFSNNSGPIVTFDAQSEVTRSAHTGAPSNAAGESIGGTGSATPDAMNIMQPSIVKRKIITTGGV